MGKKELVFLVLSIFVCILVLELFVRSYFYSPLTILPNYGNSIAGIGQIDLLKTSKDCKIVFDIKPNREAILQLKEFKSNSQGLRDKEYSLEKPADTYRVLVLGDSTTFGYGVDVDDLYHSILEREYSEASETLIYEFINFGVPGYMLSQSLATLINNSANYDPDHILIGISPENDIPLKTDVSEWCNWEKQKRIYHYFDWWTHDLIKKKFFPKKGSKWERDFERFDSEIVSFKNFSKRDDIDLTFVILGRPGNGKFAIDSIDIFKNMFNKYNLTFIETGKEFGENPNPFDYYIYKEDAHPNKKANEIYARAIKKELLLD